MGDQKREIIRKYFQTAWSQVFEEMSCQLRSHGFSPKGNKGKFIIGSVHGQVYAYTSENSRIHDTLYLLMINPTHTDKLSIKLTFKDSRNFQEVEKRIRTMIGAKALGTPGLNEEGRFVSEYFFYSDLLPADPLGSATYFL